MILKNIKKFILIIFFLTIIFNIHSSPAVSQTINMKIPSKFSFKINMEFIRPFKLKKITAAEYITDPIIMYAALWGCFGLGLSLWERNPDVYASDGERGFDKIFDEPYYLWANDSNNKNKPYNTGILFDNTFLNRMALEPFASNRIDPIMKESNGITVFRNDIYVKNILEPAFFIFLALYMRSKDYHPAIMVVEIILLSVIYEFTIRPFYMNSSFEQLLKNPAIGLVIAIFLDELSNFLLSTPYKGLHILAYFLNPFNALPNARIHPMLFFNPYKNTASIEAIIKF